MLDNKTQQNENSSEVVDDEVSQSKNPNLQSHYMLQSVVVIAIVVILLFTITYTMQWLQVQKIDDSKTLSSPTNQTDVVETSATGSALRLQELEAIDQQYPLSNKAPSERLQELEQINQTDISSDTDTQDSESRISKLQLLDQN